MKGVKMQQSTNKIDHVRNLVDHETRGSDSLPEVNPDIKVNKPIEKYVHPHGRGNVNLQNKGKNKYRPRSSRRNENNNIQYTIRESNYPKCTRKEYTIGEVASIKISNKKDSASSSFSSNHANESKPWRQPNGPTQSKGFTNKRNVDSKMMSTKTKTGGLMAVVTKYQEKQFTNLGVQSEQETRIRSGSIPAAASLLGDIDANCYSTFDPVDCSSPKSSLPLYLQLNAFRKTPGASRPPGMDLLNKESMTIEHNIISSVNKNQDPNTLASHIGRDGYSKSLNDLPDTPTCLLPAGLIPEISCTPCSPNIPLTVVPVVSNVVTYASTLAVSTNGSTKANSNTSSRSCSPCNFSELSEAPPTLSSLPPNKPIDLVISNLDYNISGGEWKKILYSEFNQNVPVLNIRIHTQLDNTDIAIITVSDRDDAIFAITHFHRKKIGYKRIHVNILTADQEPLLCTSNKAKHEIKKEVVSILSNVVGCSMPISMLCDFYLKRNKSMLSIRDIRDMSDCIQITEDNSSINTAILLPSARVGCLFNDSKAQDIPEIEKLRWGCTKHVAKDHTPKGLPDIKIDLKLFSTNIHALVQSHNGTLVLSSIVSCYRNEFGELDACREGVNIEHLVSIISGLKIVKTINHGKCIQWNDSNITEGTPSGSPVTQQKSQQLCRDVIETLKMQNKCRIHLSEFAEAFKSVHARECHMYDYGVSNLLDLLETIPHVVQIIGEANHKVITLTHRAQVKRFINDIRRVIKKQPSKKICLINLPKLYYDIHVRQFDISDYGVCYFKDMLIDIPEGAFIISNIGSDVEIAIPHREQSPREIAKTRMFANEVGVLLRCYRSNRGTCTMSFDRFIPHYHHQFSKQCRVSDYGFVKLIDLLDAIPHVIKITETRNEKTLFLIGPDLLKAYGEQIHLMLNSSISSRRVHVHELMATYRLTYGCDLRLEDVGASSMTELVNNLTKLSEYGLRFDGQYLILAVHEDEIDTMVSRILKLVMDYTEDGRVPYCLLSDWYSSAFFVPLMPLDQLIRHLKPLCDITSQYNENIIALNQTMLFARDLRLVLKKTSGKIAYQHFETAYQHLFKCTLAPEIYGFNSILTLLRAVSRVAVIHGYGYQCNIILTEEFIDFFQVNSNSRQECCELYHCLNDTLAGDAHSKVHGTPSSDSGILDPKFLDDGGSKETSPSFGDELHGNRCARSLQFDSALTYNSKPTSQAPHRVRSAGHLFEYQGNRFSNSNASNTTNTSNNSNNNTISYYNSRQNSGQIQSRVSSGNSIDKPFLSEYTSNWITPSNWSVGEDDFKSFKQNKNEVNSLPNLVDGLKVNTDSWPSLPSIHEPQESPRRSRIAARF